MTENDVEKSLPPVEIPAFSGPLDLLLHLIRVNEVSITDIPIAEITEQYTAYLDAMRELDLDVASDYIALAAELIYVKSRMLLPRAPGEPEEDPRFDLARRLLEYERYKQAAESFHEIDSLRAGLWSRPRTEVPRSAEGETLEVSLFDLIDTFRRVTDRYRLAHPPAMEIHHLRFSVGEKMLELVERLEKTGTPLPLLEFLGAMRYRAEAVTSFLATLELIRLGIVRVFQAAHFGEIHATRTEAPFSPEQVRDTYR
ncbi:MAG: segregation/condensation protein A [Acidobacteriota bacterium]|nr:segregation/condensation protein A [Acidobacteriota bacterium]